MNEQRIQVNWTARRVGNLGFVTETRSDGTRSDFGPIPAHTVPAFVRGRQIIVAHLLKSAGYGTSKTDAELEPDFARYFTEEPPK